jgi:alkylated DNA repair dioxygenase AlkB
MENQAKQVIQLDDGAELVYIKNFIKQEKSKELFDELRDKVPWTHGVYNMFGKPVKTPRVLYAMRDKDVDITSSYKVTGSMEWLESVELVKKEIEKISGKTIIYAQLNYYRNGDEYIGPHTDSEVQSGDIICSISLGTTRKFVLSKIIDKTNKYTIELEDGSLLIMNENAAKKQYKHALPKMKNTGPRINITFRPH